MTEKTNKRPTIKDLAKLSGVSISTVSFVMNNTSGQTISEETRKRVLECAALLGYNPCYSAKRVRKGRSDTIAVLSTYKTQSLYFLDLINGIVSEANAAGYGILMCTGNLEKEPTQCLRYYNEGRIDGVVFISSAHSEDDSMEIEYIDCFQRNNIPFTVVYGYTHQPDVYYSNVDFYSFGQKATQILLDNNCHSITYLGALDKYNSKPYLPRTEQSKIAGYMDLMRKNNCIPNTQFFPRNFQTEEFKDLIHNTVSQPCDGYITCWATFGLQLLSFLQKEGKSVPNDVKLICLDTLPYLELISSPLSAIKLPFEEMAAHATKTLIRILDGETIETKQQYFEGILELRSSSG